MDFEPFRDRGILGNGTGYKMIWDVAAGIVIGGTALGVIWGGIAIFGHGGIANNHDDAAAGLGIAALGAAFAIFILFKAFHWGV